MTASRTETAWLIERGHAENHEPTVWWSGDENIGYGGWTTDAWQAVRYPTKDAADRVLREKFTAHISQGPLGRAVEHAFAHEDPEWLREYVEFESEDKALTVVRHSHGELQFNIGPGHDFRTANLHCEDIALLAHALNQWVARFTSNA